MATAPHSAPGRRVPGRWWVAAAAAVSLGLTAVPVLVPAPSGAASPSGPVDVLSAGSLQDLLQQQVATAFQKATGDTLNDTSYGV